MAETRIATKTGIIPETEVISSEPSKTFSVKARITPDVITKFIEKNPQPLKNDEFMEKLNAYVIEEQIASPIETNTSVMKIEKTNTAIVKAAAPITEVMPIPQKPKTKEELKADKREIERLTNLEEKKKREQWNQRHAPIGYYKK